MAFPRARDASRCRAFQRRFVSKRRGLGTHNTERVTRAPPPCPERGTRTMPKKDKAKAKQQAEDARGAVTEEVSKTVDDAQHAAGGVRDSLKDAVASCRDSVETVAETTTHAMSSVTHAVSSAIEKVCLPFPRARAILAALPPSTLTRRPVIPVSSERPPRRRFPFHGNIRTAGRARRRSTRTKTERWTRETPPKSADDARRPSASSRETPQTTSQTTLLGSFQRRTVSRLRGAPAPRTAELLDEERAESERVRRRAAAFAGANGRAP